MGAVPCGLLGPCARAHAPIRSLAGLGRGRREALRAEASRWDRRRFFNGPSRRLMRIFADNPRRWRDSHYQCPSASRRTIPPPRCRGSCRSGCRTGARRCRAPTRTKACWRAGRRGRRGIWRCRPRSRAILPTPAPIPRCLPSNRAESDRPTTMWVFGSMTVDR